MKNQPKPGQIVLMASGVLMLIFSFFNFYDIDLGGFGSKTAKVWSSDGGFPLSWWPVLFGVAIAVLVALTVFANISLPSDILGFTWKQIYFILAFTSFFILLGFALADSSGKGIGLWLMFIASIGLIVGAVMELLDKSTTTGPSRQGPATPF
jgi:hypothetical protein